jgi:hypothetical protein
VCPALSMIQKFGSEHISHSFSLRPVQMSSLSLEHPFSRQKNATDRSSSTLTSGEWSGARIQGCGCASPLHTSRTCSDEVGTGFDMGYTPLRAYPSTSSLDAAQDALVAASVDWSRTIAAPAPTGSDFRVLATGATAFRSWRPIADEAAVLPNKK